MESVALMVSAGFVKPDGRLSVHQKNGCAPKLSEKPAQPLRAAIVLTAPAPQKALGEHQARTAPGCC